MGLTERQFTVEEIDNYCAHVENLHLSSRTEGALLFRGVQIIKQLQGQATQEFYEE